MDGQAMAAPRVLVFAGSARQGAFSKRLARAAEMALSRAGAAVTRIDLADFPQPLYDADLEAAEGLPASIVALQGLLASHDALVVATPEYNGSVTPLLKNTLDWCSRANRADPAAPSGLAVFADKPAAVLASSPGALGGMRALFHLRDLLGYLGMVVIPQQLAVGQAATAFAEDGTLADERQRKSLADVAASLVRLARH